MISAPPPALSRLPVRVRRVVGPRGVGAARATVACPQRDRTVTIDECAACTFYGGLVGGADGASVLCAVHACPRRAALPPTGDAAVARAALAPVAEVMTRDVVCATADLPIAKLLVVLLERGFSGAPVVDDAGRPIGIVSKTDLLRGAEDADPDREMRVADVMTSIVLSVHEGSTIGQTAALMAYEGVHRLLVVAEPDEIVGIVSALDLLEWLGRASGFFIPHRARR